jgi:hypothetical protein
MLIRAGLHPADSGVGGGNPMAATPGKFCPIDGYDLVNGALVCAYSLGRSASARGRRLEIAGNAASGGRILRFGGA